MRAAQDREADDVDVFLHGGGGDHLGRLVQPGVDDFHAGVAQRGGDDFRAAVVAVEAGFGDKNTNGTPVAAARPGLVASPQRLSNAHAPRHARRLVAARA